MVYVTLTLFLAVSAQVFYVANDGNALSRNCSSDDPCASINQAYLLAMLQNSTDIVVKLAPGRYAGSQNVGLVFQSSVFIIAADGSSPEDVVIEGGKTAPVCFTSFQGTLSLNTMTIEGCSYAAEVVTASINMYNCKINGGAIVAAGSAESATFARVNLTSCIIYQSNETSVFSNMMTSITFTTFSDSPLNVTGSGKLNVYVSTFSEENLLRSLLDINLKGDVSIGSSNFSQKGDVGMLAEISAEYLMISFSTFLGSSQHGLRVRAFSVVV